MTIERRRFKIGDEVCVRGVVCLLDAAGPGTVTIKIHATEQRRITLPEDAISLEEPKDRR